MDPHLTVSGVSSHRLREAMYANVATTYMANNRPQGGSARHPQAPPNVYHTVRHPMPKPPARSGQSHHLNLASLLTGLGSGAVQAQTIVHTGAATARMHPKPPTTAHAGHPVAPPRHPVKDGTVAPLTAARAVTMYPTLLTSYEMREIFDYSAIYFLGTAATKAHSPENGFDDEAGDYLVVPHDHISFRYEVLKPLGRGSFGQVVRAHDYKTGHIVALKIIRNKKKFHQQALVEVKLLEYIKLNDPEGKSGCVRFLDSFLFRNHMCITFEVLHINLYEYVKETNFEAFSETLLRKTAAQLVTSLSFLWKHNIVHCDIKPENILLCTSGRSQMKLIDFGSSCFEAERIYTYIQSRFYRAPEIMLGLPYTRSIDTWSLGCVLCELLLGYPIFPGESEPEQLGLIMEALGPPPRAMVNATSASRRRTFFEPDGVTAKPVVTLRDKRLLRVGTRPLARTLRLTEGSQLLDFLDKTLTWDPTLRITPDECMRHPWLASMFAKAPASHVELPYLESRATSARRKQSLPSPKGSFIMIDNGIQQTQIPQQTV